MGWSAEQKEKARERMKKRWEGRKVLSPRADVDVKEDGMGKELVCVHLWTVIAYDPDSDTNVMREIKKCGRCNSTWRSGEDEPRVVLFRSE